VSTAGYSGTPLIQKLGFKPGMRALYVNAPAGFGDFLGALPGLRAKLASSGMVWVAWPKRASKVPTDMTEDVVRDVALPRGLVDVKVCAIDATWSGLKLVIRRELR
jgi:hypothetical protein